MIDKTLRKATAERHGPVVVVRYMGYCDGLCLIMFLDCEHGQMSFQFIYGSTVILHTHCCEICIHMEYDLLPYFIEYLADEDCMLRMFADENHEKNVFDGEGYTPWQKRFAEICREDIAPKLKELLMENKYD